MAFGTQARRSRTELKEAARIDRLIPMGSRCEPLVLFLGTNRQCGACNVSLKLPRVIYQATELALGHQVIMQADEEANARGTRRLTDLKVGHVAWVIETKKLMDSSFK